MSTGAIIFLVLGWGVIIGGVIVTMVSLLKHSK